MTEPAQYVQPDYLTVVGLDVFPEEEALTMSPLWMGTRPRRIRLRDQLPEPLRTDLDRLLCEAAHPANRRRRPQSP